jgi:type IV secretory pathway TrbL component
LDPPLGSNSWVLSSSSSLDTITGYKMAISELYFQTCFAFVIELVLFVIFFWLLYWCFRTVELY